MSSKRTRTKAETAYIYNNKFLGKQITFKPKADEVIVTLQPQPDAAAQQQALKTLPFAVSQGASSAEGFATLRIATGQNLSTVTRALTALPQVANVLPALLDDQGVTRYFLPGEFTVQFAKGIAQATAERIIKEEGCRIVTRQRTPGYYTLEAPEGRGLFEMIRQFSARAEVAFAEPHEAIFNYGCYVPNDPEFPDQWALPNTGQSVANTTGTPGADIDVTPAWDITRGDPNVIIAIVDSGVVENNCDNIDAQNPAFIGKLGRGRINAFRALSSLLFSINAPSELRLVRNSTAIVPVTILRANTFSNAVELSVQGAPVGVGASLNPAAVTGTSSQLTVTIGNIANGTHTLTLRGASGAISKTDTVLLKIKDFFISLTPLAATSAATLVAGSPAVEIAVTIQRSPGFNQSVALAVEGLPQSTQLGAGVSATFEPSSISGNTSTLRLKAGRFAPSMSFVLTLRGTSGNLVDTVTLGVEVVDSESP